MGVADELTGLAASGASGLLEVNAGSVSGRIWLRAGRVGAVSLSTDRAALGMRLVSGGALSLTSLGQALSVQQQHPQMRLGDILVRMGLVDRQQVEAVAWEQMCDDMLAMLEWTAPRTSFLPIPPESLPPGGPSVQELIEASAKRAEQLRNVVQEVGGPDCVPQLGEAAMEVQDTVLRPVEWSVLCRIDGHRTLRTIAEQSGFTLLEAATILQGLVVAGLATMQNTEVPKPVAKPAPWPQADSDPTEFLRELSELGGSTDPFSRRRHAERNR